jgi:acyl carrier protein
MSQTGGDVATDVKGIIKQFIVDNFLFGSTGEGFGDDDSFLENGIIDSTGILELIEFIESTYGIQTENDKLVPENLDSLNNVTRFVLKKKSG